MKRVIIKSIIEKPATSLMLLTGAVAAAVLAFRVIRAIIFVMEMDR